MIRHSLLRLPGWRHSRYRRSQRGHSLAFDEGDLWERNLRAMAEGQPHQSLWLGGRRVQRQLFESLKRPRGLRYTTRSTGADQAVVYLERLPDEFQTDHMDWGFRVSAMYGLDYRFTISRGLFSSQLLKYNEKYGFDMPMIYFDWYIPGFFDGVNIRIGRYISLPDIEAQLAPNNPMYTHSLLYTFDPFTQEGIMTSIKLSPNWTFQFGVSAGNDQAIWDSQRG